MRAFEGGAKELHIQPLSMRWMCPFSCQAMPTTWWWKCLAEETWGNLLGIWGLCFPCDDLEVQTRWACLPFREGKTTYFVRPDFGDSEALLGLGLKGINWIRPKWLFKKLRPNAIGIGCWLKRGCSYTLCISRGILHTYPIVVCVRISRQVHLRQCAFSHCV